MYYRRLVQGYTGKQLLAFSMLLWLSAGMHALALAAFVSHSSLFFATFHIYECQPNVSGSGVKATEQNRPNDNKLIFSMKRTNVTIQPLVGASVTILLKDISCRDGFVRNIY